MASNKTTESGASVSANVTPGPEPSGTESPADGPQSAASASPAQPSGSSAIASQASTVAGRPWLVRDAHGVFRAASPAGADPVVTADVEAFEKGIEGSYPNASPALRLMAVRTFAAFRRLERAAETSAIRPGGRVPAALREAGAFLDRLTRIIESLEATQAKRGGKGNAPRTDLAALAARSQR